MTGLSHLRYSARGFCCNLLRKQFCLNRWEQKPNGVRDGKNPEAKPHQPDEPGNDVAAIMVVLVVRFDGRFLDIRHESFCVEKE